MHHGTVIFWLHFRGVFLLEMKELKFFQGNGNQKIMCILNSCWVIVLYMCILCSCASDFIILLGYHFTGVIRNRIMYL